MKMINAKNLFFRAAILLLIHTVSYAQETGYGIRLGINSSNIKIKHDSAGTLKGKGILTPVIGATAYAKLAEKIGLVTEVNLYAMTGTKYKDTVAITDNSSFPPTVTKKEIEDNLKVYAPNWTLGITFNFTENVFIMGGAVLDAVFKRYYKGEMAGTKNEEEHTVPVKYIVESEKTIKFNACIGAGYAYKLVRGDIRYTAGFGNLFDEEKKESKPEYNGFQKASYNSLQVSVTVIIPRLKWGVGKKRHY